MPATVRLEIAQEQLRRALTGPNGSVTRYVMRTTRQIRNKAVMYCPVDTGNLRASITHAVSSDVAGRGMVVVGRVGTPVEYALAVHEGVKAQTVTVAAHQVKAHTVKAHEVRARRGRKRASKAGPRQAPRAAYTVRAHTVRAHTRASYTMEVKARAGRPFLRRALEEVLPGHVSRT